LAEVAPSGEKLSDDIEPEITKKKLTVCQTALFSLFDTRLKPLQATELFIKQVGVSECHCNKLCIVTKREVDRDCLELRFKDEPLVTCITAPDYLHELAVAHRVLGDTEKAEIVDAVNELLFLGQQPHHESFRNSVSANYLELLLQLCITCCALKEENALLACGNMSLTIFERLDVGALGVRVAAAVLRECQASKSRHAPASRRIALSMDIGPLVCIETDTQNYYRYFASKLQKLLQAVNTLAQDARDRTNALCRGKIGFLDIFCDYLRDQINAIGLMSPCYFSSEDDAPLSIFPSLELLAVLGKEVDATLARYLKKKIPTVKPEWYQAQNPLCSYKKAFLDATFANDSACGATKNLFSLFDDCGVAVSESSESYEGLETLLEKTARALLASPRMTPHIIDALRTKKASIMNSWKNGLVPLLYETHPQAKSLWDVMDKAMPRFNDLTYEEQAILALHDCARNILSPPSQITETSSVVATAEPEVPAH
jgi:hypothetical protein